MRKFWSSLAVQLGKRAGLVSIVGLLLTVGLGLGIPKLKFATGQDSYLNKGDQVAKDNVAYQRLFGGEIMITLFTMDGKATVADLASPANRAKIEEATKELEANKENIEAVVSPITALEFTQNLLVRPFDKAATPLDARDATTQDILGSVAGTILADAQKGAPEGSAERKAREADFAKTTQRITPFLVDQKGLKSTDPGARSFDNPKWVEFLLYGNDGKIRKPLRSAFFDPKHAQMVVRLKGNGSVEEEGKGAVAVKDAWKGVKIEGSTLTVTGAPVLLRDINNYLRGGILTLGGIAVAIMVVILLVLFDVRWRLLPLAVILLGVTWAFGLAGYLGIPLTIVTIAGLPVMLGVGIDYAIQMHARVEEEVVIDRNEHPIQETARNLGPALLVVTFDAVFAFCALLFAKVPMLRDFGILLAIGIAVICLCSIVAPLAALGIREYKSPTKGRDFREGALGRFVVKLGGLPAKAAIPLSIAAVAIFFGGLAVEDKLTLQTDPIQWVNQHTQNRKDVATLEREVDASSELGIYVTAKDDQQLFSDDMGAFLQKFTNKELADHEDLLLVANSIATPISFLTELPGVRNPTPTGAQLKAVYDAAPPAVRALAVNAKSNAVNVLFVTKPASLEERSVLVDAIRKDFKTDLEPPSGIQATPSGLAVVGTGLLKNLESNRVLLTYLSILFVFAFLTIRLRSAIRSLLSLVPVLIAVGMASLIAYTFSLKLSPMTAVGGPLVIAACTEFTSLILLRFVEERGRGLNPKAAVDVTAARTGRAFIVSGLTAITGVAVIAGSSLPLLRDFGIIVGMNTAVALLSALVVLPPMLVWADDDSRRWVSKGMIPKDVLDQANRTHDDVPSASTPVAPAD